MVQEKQDKISAPSCQEEVFYYELMEVKDFRCAAVSGDTHVVGGVTFGRSLHVLMGVSGCYWWCCGFLMSCRRWRAPGAQHPSRCTKPQAQPCAAACAPMRNHALTMLAHQLCSSIRALCPPALQPRMSMMPVNDFRQARVHVPQLHVDMQGTSH